MNYVRAKLKACNAHLKEELKLKQHCHLTEGYF